VHPRIGIPAMDAGPEALHRQHLILLPTLNEEEGIRATLEEFRVAARFPEGETPPILVIDGRSTDRTVEIAREYGCEVLQQTGRGKGSAVRDGLAWATDHGFGSIGILDADATYPAHRLPALFRLLDDGFDLVIGVRRPDHPAPSTPRNLVHRVGNGLLGFCAAEFSHGPILDVCSGFWGLKTEWIPSLQLESTGFEIESEIFVKSFRRGLRVCQIPISYRKRLGTAKLHAIRDGARIFLSILRYSGRALDPQSGPTPAMGATGRRRRAGSSHVSRLTVPSLAAILLTLQPQLVVVASTPMRRREAAGLARNLPQDSYSVQLQLSKGDPVGRLSGPGPWAGIDSGPFTLGDRPVVVSLPDAPLDLQGLRRMVVSVPGQDWVMSLGPTLLPNLDDPHGTIPGDAAKGDPTPQRFPRPSSWGILGAVLDPSWARKERALLGAAVSAVGATILTLPFTPATPGQLRTDGPRGPILPETPGVSPG
jgi:dolichol-phosphate mannosyltransferase